LQTLAHCQLVRQITMLTLLMQMETYTSGMEVLGLMRVRLLDRRDQPDQLVLLALLRGLLETPDRQEQPVRRALQDLQEQLEQQVQLLFGTLLVPITAEHHTQLVI